MTAMAGRTALAELQNTLKAAQALDLNVEHAMEEWDAAGQVQRDLAAAKDQFSQAKFVYLEQATKGEFVREIVEGGEDDKRDLESAEERVAECKQAVKKAKGRCDAVKEEIGVMISQTLEKKAELSAEVEALNKLVEERMAQGDDGAHDAAADLARLEAEIANKQQALQEQEKKMRELGQQRQELEVAVRGLEADVATAQAEAAPNYRETRDRRMAAWYRAANATLSSLANVAAVRLGEFDAEVEIDVLPYSSAASTPSTAGKRYALVLSYDHVGVPPVEPGPQARTVGRQRCDVIPQHGSMPDAPCASTRGQPTSRPVP
jgi:DNA repair exonuclease SbcCD ATPase subunit